jgi:hypothetical protein
MVACYVQSGQEVNGKVSGGPIISAFGKSVYTLRGTWLFVSSLRE